MKLYVGIDNGVTGTIGVVAGNGKWSFKKTPTKKELSYTKTKQEISRIDYPKLVDLLKRCKKNTLVIIERPMVNPGRYKATMSALRALEATLIAVEESGLPYMYIDSKEWQKEMLPKIPSKKTKAGKLKKPDPAVLKKASLQIGKRLFPGSEKVTGIDCDGLHIAEYARRKKL